MNTKFVTSLALGALAGACELEDGGAVVYNYNQNGADWGIDSPLCDTGVEQSPIDLTAATLSEKLMLSLADYENYVTGDVKLKDHTLEFGVTDGVLSLAFGDDQLPADFNPLQFHFHAPSEHVIDGEYMDLEVHIVHLYSTGGLGAVIGIMFDRVAGGNSDNPFIEALDFENADPDGNPVENVNLKDFLDGVDMTNFWSYNGSLTTPPCTEGIKWTVIKDVQPISDAQLAGFNRWFSSRPEYAMGNGNNREV